jgi:hybrid cluster-associated redox disulfide protein
MVAENNLTSSNHAYVLTKFDLLLNVVQESPRAAQLLTEYGLHCLTCFFNEFDTLEMGAKVHGMTDKEVDDMINEINTQLEKEFKEQNKKISNGLTH